MPALWRLFRGRMTRTFDRLAPEWDTTRVSAESSLPIAAALDALPTPPPRACSISAPAAARSRGSPRRASRGAEVTGADVSRGMVAEARAARRDDRERYARSPMRRDLPFPDGAFDLVTLNNMIPFFDELARVVDAGRPCRCRLLLGASTPIWVPLERVRHELEQRGFAHIADFSVGPGVALLARKGGTVVSFVPTETFATRYHRSGRLFSCGYRAATLAPARRGSSVGRAHG